MPSTFRPLGSAYRLTRSRYFAVRGFVRCRDCNACIRLHRDQEHAKHIAAMTNVITLKTCFMLHAFPPGAAVSLSISRLAATASTDYSAAACVWLLVKLGGRFSRKADNASLASGPLTRFMNSWLSLSIAALSWPIEGCLRSRLLANNAPLS